MWYAIVHGSTFCQGAPTLAKGPWRSHQHAVAAWERFGRKCRSRGISPLSMVGGIAYVIEADTRRGAAAADVSDDGPLAYRIVERF